MNKVVPIVTCVLGAVAGAAVTWVYAKKKYEDILQTEINSVKEVYSSKKKEESSDEDEEEHPRQEDFSQADHAEAEAKVGVYSPSNYEGQKVVTYKSDIDYDAPYVISPEEFGEIYDYNERSLVYYSDKILADDEGNLVEDIDSIIGEESLTHFGEYEDDAVHVRNDRLCNDYEILLDPRTYEEAMQFKAKYDQEE